MKTSVAVTVLVTFSLHFAGGIAPAWAKQTGCDCGGTPPSLNDAVNDAVLVFSGKVERLTWRRPASTVNEVDLGGGKKKTTADYVDPKAPEESFDPSGRNSETQYIAHFSEVDRWKDSQGAVKDRHVVVQVANLGNACWFEVGREYLVFAKTQGAYPPVTNLCTRTRPLAQAQEDVELLRKGEKHK